MLNIRYGGLVAFHYFPPQRQKQRMQRTVGLSGEANVLCVFSSQFAHIINKSVEETKKKKTAKSISFVVRVGETPAGGTTQGPAGFLTAKSLMCGPAYKDKCHFSYLSPPVGVASAHCFTC